MQFFDQFRAGRAIQKLKNSRTLPETEVAKAQDQLRAMGPSAMRPLVECLSHGNARNAAIEVLGSFLNEDTLQDFLDALNSSNPATVSGITLILAGSHSYDATRLLPLLSDPSLPKSVLETVLAKRIDDIPPRRITTLIPELGKDARSVAFRLLEKVVDESVIEDVIPFLEHEDWWVRLYAAKLLGDFSDDRGIRGLRGTLQDENKSVRLEAVQSLHRLQVKEAVPELALMLRESDLKLQTAAIEALEDLAGPESVPHLVDVLKDESEHARRAAVEVLNKVATPEAVQDLVRALRDEDWWVRVRAADALGSLGGDRVVDAVVGLLGEDDEFMRRYAVEILIAIPSKRAVPPLIAALQDRDWWVRERSIDALAKTGDARAVEPLLVLMGEEAQAVPLCARALGELQDPRAVEALCGIARSDVAEHRREAVTALAGMPRGRLSPQQKEQVAAILIRAKVSTGGDIPARRSRTDSPGDSPRVRMGNLGTVSPTPLTPRELPDSVSPTGSRGVGSSGSRDRAPTPVKNTGMRDRINYHKLPKDTLLLDRFRVLRQIGKGGFGSIYLVRDSAVDEEIILKILNPQLSSDETGLQRFVQELKLTRKITHPNVIRIYDLLDLGGAHAVSMEFFDAQDLGRAVKNEKRLSPARVLRIVQQVCAGLAAAHDENVIHRDIKPSNILANDTGHVKLVDFGLASATQQLGDSRLTKSGLLIGTPEYMAPEQINGNDVDHRADLYSLGIVMYELLSGQKPFRADTPVKVLFQHLEGEVTPLGQLADGITLDLEYLVSTAMARDPGDRPADARQMAGMATQALEAINEAA